MPDPTLLGPLWADNALRELVSIAALARANLGIGGAGALDVGSAANTVAAGDDPRFITFNSGPGVPHDADGADGDWYLHTSTGDFYERVHGHYAVLMNLTGPLGQTGPRGSQGPAALIGIPKGMWNASTNDRGLASGVGTPGDVWTVAVAGSTDLDGITGWERGDAAYFGLGGVWERFPAGALDAAYNSISLPSSLIYEIADGTADILGVDINGFVARRFSADGVQYYGKADIANLTAGSVSAGALSAAAIDTDAMTMAELTIGNTVTRWIDDGRGDILYSDQFGFVSRGLGLLEDGTEIGGTGGTGGGGSGTTADYSPEELLARDALAFDASLSIRDIPNLKIARPIWTYNQIITYGQSLSHGEHSVPVLTTTQPFDSLSFGQHPLNTAAGVTFVPAGDSLFHPLAADTQESPGVALTNTWRQGELAWRCLAADPTRLLVQNDCGVGGKTIEELSKGASLGLEEAIPDLATKAKAAAVGLGGTYGVTGVIWWQGEWNYRVAEGGTHDRAAYAALLAQLKADIYADLLPITGQALPPALFVIQTSSFWETGADTINIGSAQLDACLADPGVYLVGPVYSVPTNLSSAGHLSNDGSRWMGSMLGKVMHKVLDRGEGWLPFHPTRVTLRGLSLLIEFHVPAPPIVVGPCRRFDNSLQTFADLGFTIYDDDGTIGIVSITPASCTVLIVLQRLTTAAKHPIVQYADHGVHNGGGNLHDSDPTLARDISIETGLPYPLYNWLVAFSMPIVVE